MNFIYRRLSISNRIALTYSVILFVILITFSGIISRYIFYEFMLNDQDELLTNAAYIENYMNKHQNLNVNELKNLNLGYTIAFNLYDKNKRLVYTNKPDLLYWEAPDFINPVNIYMFDKNHTIPPLACLNKTINSQGNLYYLQIGREIGHTGNFFKILFRTIIFASIIGIIVCLLSGSYLSKKLMEPIRNISTAAKELSAKSLNKRILVDGPDDEIKELANTFNSMIERLENDFEKQIRFVYDASHELRTPLSVIYGNITMLNRWGKENPEVLAKALTTLKNETESMNKLIANLLYLARSDSNTLVLKYEDFSVDKLLKEVVDETLLVNNDYSVNYSCDKDFMLYADYNLIKQVIRILLDNSIKYSSPPGDIEIKAAPEENGTKISVVDKGHGIPEESLPLIFDRFYRADQSRTKATGGTGLGLSIAKQIVQSHNGNISAQSVLGEGTRIDVFIPV